MALPLAGLAATGISKLIPKVGKLFSSGKKKAAGRARGSAQAFNALFDSVKQQLDAGLADPITLRQLAEDLRLGYQEFLAEHAATKGGRGVIAKGQGAKDPASLLAVISQRLGSGPQQQQRQAAVKKIGWVAAGLGVLGLLGGAVYALARR